MSNRGVFFIQFYSNIWCQLHYVAYCSIAGLPNHAISWASCHALWNSHYSQIVPPIVVLQHFVSDNICNVSSSFGYLICSRMESVAELISDFASFNISSFVPLKTFSIISSIACFTEHVTSSIILGVICYCFINETLYVRITVFI